MPWVGEGIGLVEGATHGDGTGVWGGDPCRVGSQVVVLHEAGAVDEAALKTYVKDNLAAFKVPREVVFLDALPRNATGKVLKRDLS